MRIRNLLIISAIAAGTVACGSGGEAAPTTDGGGSVDAGAASGSEGPDLSGEEFDDLTGEDAVGVIARDNAYVAPYIEVSAGTTVDFTNRGRTEHNVLPVEPGAFAEIPTEELGPGDEASVTFASPGTYAYYCSLHGTKTKGMVGAVRVLE